MKCEMKDCYIQATNRVNRRLYCDKHYKEFAKFLVLNNKPKKKKKRR